VSEAIVTLGEDREARDDCFVAKAIVRMEAAALAKAIARTVGAPH
jgi:hypothetical protein